MLHERTTRHLAYHATPRPLAAMEVDYPDGTSTGLHAHPRAQLLHAIQGVMIVRSAVGIWVVPPNRAVWLTAGIEHEVRMCGDVKIRTVFVDPDASAFLPAASCVVAVSPLLRELIVAAVGIPPDYAPGGRDERLMQLLLDELQGRDVLPLHLPMPRDRRVRTVCEALAARPGDEATAGQWASRLGVTPKTLHRLFPKETGLTFGQWRQQARLLGALERLAKGERIVEVALDSGYASQSAFTAMFRRHFGMPPGLFHR
ncbi:AraC family transcriptional regulator [Labrys monachus]|uniref:AraC-like DNA-binding protein/quercetin dioxygenase-like cupin family protein n=1 Tax=Labrys monachus TaxID=217067 RepID=A0ABU0FNX3_9HYPH|nr:helix-turn-helix transcriptional regulator [Labrys monachus]MDQ0396307.1 AraC-like DNA-binding protein/quercetin dioxygenase-like cupin family protein [Labrys monachus]